MFDLSGLYGVLAVLLSVLLALVTAFSGYLLYVHGKYSHIPGPPRDSFILGHVPTIRRMRRNNKEIYELVHEWNKQYGPLFVFWAFHNPIVIVISPELVKQVALTLNLPKAPRVYGGLQSVYNQRCTGRGILTEFDHEVWQRKRSTLNPAFHRKYLMNLMQAFNVICERMIDKLSRLADGKTHVDMANELSRVTLDVIGKVAFDVDLHSIEDDNTPFPSANITALTGIQESFRDPFWRINVFNFPYQRKVIKAIQFLRQFGETVILRRKAAVTQDSATPRDILDHILQMANVPMEELVDDFLTFFIAGQETTSNQLAFTIFEIGTNPEIEQRIVDEISHVLGSRHTVDYVDLGKLQYLGQTLKESLRLHPPIAGMTRCTREDVEIGGYTIPAKTEVGITMYCTHRYSEVWPEPEKFDPDRFGPSADDGNITGAMYFPFSLGPRSCIGKTFAQFESKVLMARLYQQFHIKLVPGQKLMNEVTLTMRPKGGVWCTLEKRPGMNKQQHVKTLDDQE